MTRIHPTTSPFALMAPLLTALLFTATPQAAAQAAAPAKPSAAWAATERAARGQTVNFYMWGGSDNINRYVDTVVAPAARKLGVTVRRVPVTDTAQAVNKVLGEKRAGFKAHPEEAAV